MPSSRFPDNLSDDQSKTVEKAAHLIIKARQEADAMIKVSGLEPIPDDGWYGSPCGKCACRNYSGQGGPCESPITTGSGVPAGECGHRPSQHLAT